MVIEAVIEDIGLKQRIFVDLETHCPPHAILSTNTSTINIELVGAKLKVGVIVVLQQLLAGMSCMELDQHSLCCPMSMFPHMGFPVLQECRMFGMSVVVSVDPIVVAVCSPPPRSVLLAPTFSALLM